jgi:hypothetical protein
VIEQQVQLEVFTAYLKRILAVHESEAEAKLKEGFAEVFQ